MAELERGGRQLSPECPYVYSTRFCSRDPFFGSLHGPIVAATDGGATRTGTRLRVMCSYLQQGLRPRLSRLAPTRVLLLVLVPKLVLLPLAARWCASLKAQCLTRAQLHSAGAGWGRGSHRALPTAPPRPQLRAGRITTTSANGPSLAGVRGMAARCRPTHRGAPAARCRRGRRPPPVHSIAPGSSAGPWTLRLRAARHLPATMQQ